MTEEEEPGGKESTQAALASAVDAMDVRLQDTERCNTPPNISVEVPDDHQPASTDARPRSEESECDTAVPSRLESEAESAVEKYEDSEAAELVGGINLAEAHDIRPQMTPAMIMERQRKIAVVYELLIACVADTPQEKAGKAVLRAGYDARHRVALRLLASWLDISWRKVVS